MELENYFDFQRHDDIRIRGTRVGIETVLYDYLFRARTPEEIADTYKTIDLEQVYATILYYLQNKDAVTQYLEEWLEWGHEQRKAQALNPPPAVERLRKLKAERSSKVGSRE